MNSWLVDHLDVQLLPHPHTVLWVTLLVVWIVPRIYTCTSFISGNSHGHFFFSSFTHSEWCNWFWINKARSACTSFLQLSIFDWILSSFGMHFYIFRSLTRCKTEWLLLSNDVSVYQLHLQYFNMERCWIGDTESYSDIHIFVMCYMSLSCNFTSTQISGCSPNHINHYNVETWHLSQMIWYRSSKSPIYSIYSLLWCQPSSKS